MNPPQQRHRCCLPLRFAYCRATTATHLWADLTLRIQTTQLLFEELLFKVDSGANISLLRLSLAESLGLPVPAGPPVSLRFRTAAGYRNVLVRRGEIGAQLPDWSELFEWPCYFVANQPEEVPPLLGLWGVVNSRRLYADNTPAPVAAFDSRLRLTFDGTPSSSAPFGNLIVDVL